MNQQAGPRLLGLSVARTAVEAIEKEAERLGITVSASVVDLTGTPILVARMDGAIAASVELAIGKAFSAVFWQRPTSELAALASTQPAFFQALMATARRPLIPLSGGLPIVHDRSIVGGIGVSGARTPEEDVICAQAGLLASGFSPA